MTKCLKLYIFLARAKRIQLEILESKDTISRRIIDKASFTQEYQVFFFEHGSDNF